VTAQQLRIAARDRTPLAATRWPGGGPTVVFLHAGVADRRSWDGVAAELAADDLDLVAVDRRGHGDTPAADDASSTHVGDLVDVLDHLGLDRVLLVGNSRGGALALDTALLHPERVVGAVVVGSAVSGMTDDDTPFDWQLDPATAPLEARSEDPAASVDDRIAALAHLWLDGPTAEEGRVGGAARALFTTMNRRILDVAAPRGAGDAGVDAWTRLGEIAVPVTCAWGDLDLPCDLPFYDETVRRLGQGPARVLPGVAHLPGLERPAVVAELVREALGR
jgi:pimeloyl-ACP methyl ester carboxylesterase